MAGSVGNKTRENGKVFESAPRWHDLGLRQKSHRAVKSQPVVEEPGAIADEVESLQRALSLVSIDRVRADAEEIYCVVPPHPLRTKQQMAIGKVQTSTRACTIL